MIGFLYILTGLGCCIAGFLSHGDHALLLFILGFQFYILSDTTLIWQRIKPARITRPKKQREPR